MWHKGGKLAGISGKGRGEKGKIILRKSSGGWKKKILQWREKNMVG